jgi:hypothetical protein
VSRKEEGLGEGLKCCLWLDPGLEGGSLLGPGRSKRALCCAIAKNKP